MCYNKIKMEQWSRWKAMNKKRCIIVTAYGISNIKKLIETRESDLIICADGGYTFANLEDIIPDVVIGDFDSYSGDLDSIKCKSLVQVPIEKDDTDTLLCVKYALKQHYKDFIILGGLGGRLDHTIANLQAMAYICDQGAQSTLVDNRNFVTMLGQGELLIPRKKDQKLSLLAFSEKCTGVSISGVQYPLNNVTLKNNFPLGISNEFTSDYATIKNGSGKLLVILTKD